MKWEVQEAATEKLSLFERKSSYNNLFNAILALFVIWGLTGRLRHLSPLI